MKKMFSIVIIFIVIVNSFASILTVRASEVADEYATFIEYDALVTGNVAEELNLDNNNSINVSQDISMNWR